MKPRRNVSHHGQKLPTLLERRGEHLVKIQRLSTVIMNQCMIVIIEDFTERIGDAWGLSNHQGEVRVVQPYPRRPGQYLCQLSQFFSPRLPHAPDPAQRGRVKISGQAEEILSRSRTGTPRASSWLISFNNASAESTTPLPIRHSTSSRRIPRGGGKPFSHPR